MISHLIKTHDTSYVNCNLVKFKNTQLGCYKQAVFLAPFAWVSHLKDWPLLHSCQVGALALLRSIGTAILFIQCRALEDIIGQLSQGGAGRLLQFGLFRFWSDWKAPWKDPQFPCRQLDCPPWCVFRMLSMIILDLVDWIVHSFISSYAVTAGGLKTLTRIPAGNSLRNRVVITSSPKV